MFLTRRVKLIPAEDVSSIDLLLYVIEAGVVAIGYNGVTNGFEEFQVVNDFVAKECILALKGWFVDNDLCPFVFYAFHDALYGRMAEIVGIGLHG